MRSLVFCALCVITACHDFSYSSVFDTEAVVPILDGTKLLVGEHFRHTRLDTDDRDADPELLEQHATLYQMTPTGQVLWKAVIDDAGEVRWVGRLTDRNVMIVSGKPHWLARAYDDTGKQVWQTTLPDDVIAYVLGYGFVGSYQRDATAAVFGDYIRIVRFHDDTLHLDADGHLTSEPAPWPPAGLEVEPPGFSGTVWSLVDGGTAVFGRPIDDPRGETTLIARYSADGVLLWTTTVHFVVHAVTLRNDDTLAVTGFASTEFDPSMPRYLVFDAAGMPIVDVALPSDIVQVTECMTPDGTDGMMLHGPATVRVNDALQIRILRLDGRGAIVTDTAASLPVMSAYGFDTACRVGYANVIQADANVGLLDPLGAPVD
jgi:hypothetical protein